MANGAHALLPLELEPPAAPGARATGAAPAVPTKIELEIGEATADAVEAIGRAMVDFKAGGAMTPATRALSGEVLGRVAQLQLATLGELSNFSIVALAEGKRTLLARHGATLREHCGTVPEAALDELLNYVIGIANKVVRDELMLRAN